MSRSFCFLFLESRGYATAPHLPGSHDSLPWLDGCLGETFTIPDKPDKPRRKLFIKLPKEIIEVVVSDRKFNTSRNYREGNPIKVKGEYDKEKKFQVYLVIVKK